MLQIRTFGLDESEKVNEFVKEKRLIENGIQIRENAIIVLYDNSTHFDEKSREVALMMELSNAEAKLLSAQILADQFALAKVGGMSLSPKFVEDEQQNKFALQWAEARIFCVKKLLGLDTHAMSVFGKKQYDLTKTKTAKKK